MGFTIDSLGGMCPMQAEGTVCGQPFYWRLRHGGWLFAAHPTDPLGFIRARDDPAPEWAGFYLTGEIDETKGDNRGGWMPEEDAKRLIEACCAKAIAYFQEKTCQ